MRSQVYAMNMVRAIAVSAVRRTLRNVVTSRARVGFDTFFMLLGDTSYLQSLVTPELAARKKEHVSER
jgi:hypothetical protein